MALQNTDHLVNHPESNDKNSDVVEYVDFHSYHGPIGPFRKSHEFSFQLEWRVAVVDAREEIDSYPDHIWLELGDLSDITTTIDSTTFLNKKIVVTAREGAKPTK